MIQTVGCQEKASKNENHFSIVNEKIYYNEVEVVLGMPIEEFEKIINSDYRIAKYSNDGGIHKDWYWMTKKLHATTSVNSEGEEIISVIKIKKYSTDEDTYIDDLSENYIDYNSIDEIVKKYGKFDSLKIDKVDTITSTFYVFDQLGFNVAVNGKDNTVSQINLYPISYSKTILEPKFNYFVPDTEKDKFISTDNKIDVENYKVMLERQPKIEFKGKFSYNKNTADFSKIGNTGWKKMVSDLEIGSSTYDPPGDSEGWSREIREDFDRCIVNIYRYNNEKEGFHEPSKKGVGKIDGVKSIEIFRFTDEDRK